MDPNTTLDQRDYASLLNDQLARKPRNILDHDGPNAIGLDPVQHGRKTRPALDRVRPAYVLVVEFFRDLQTSPLRKRLDRSTLALVAVLIRSDVGSTRRPQIRDCLSQFSWFCHSLSDISVWSGVPAIPSAAGLQKHTPPWVRVTNC